MSLDRMPGSEQQRIPMAATAKTPASVIFLAGRGGEEGLGKAPNEYFAPHHLHF
jgi:hypothetical protein